MNHRPAAPDPSRPLLRGASSFSQTPEDPPPEPSRNTIALPTVAFTYRALYDDDDDDEDVPTFQWPLHSREWTVPTSHGDDDKKKLTRCPSTGSLVSIEVLREMMMDRSGRSGSSRSNETSKRSRGMEDDDVGAAAAEGGGAWRLFPHVESFKQLPLFSRRGENRDSVAWNPFAVKKRGEEENSMDRGEATRNDSSPLRMGTGMTLRSCSSSSSSSSSLRRDGKSMDSRSRRRRSSSCDGSCCDSGTSSSTGSVNVTRGWNGLTTEWSEDRTKEWRKERRRRKPSSSSTKIINNSTHNHSPSNYNNNNHNNNPADIDEPIQTQDPLTKEVSSSSLKENQTHLVVPTSKTIIQSHSDGEISKPHYDDKGGVSRRRRVSDPTSPTLSIRTTISTMSQCPSHSGGDKQKLDSSVRETPKIFDLEEELVKLQIDAKDNVDRRGHGCGEAHGSTGVASGEDTQENDLQSTSKGVNGSEERRRSDGETTVPNHLPLLPVADVLDLNAYDILFDFDDKLKIDQAENDDDDDQSSQSGESVRLSLRNDFAKASRRGSFQRSMSMSSGFRTSISSKSCDFGDITDALDVSSKMESQLSTEPHGGGTSDEHDAVERTAVPKEPLHPTLVHSESPPHPHQTSVAPMRRRLTEQSESTAPGSTISSLDSLASPIDRARACHAQLVRSQLTQMAVVAATMPLQRETSLESMSSLGTESVARGMGRVHKRSLDNSLHRVVADSMNGPQMEGKRHTSHPRSSEHAESPAHHESRGLPQNRNENETKMNTDASVDYADLAPSRNHHDFREHSSITLGTFFSELQNSNISEADSSQDSNPIAPNRDTCDLDSAMAAFAIATKLGHFGFLHDQVILNVNTEEDNDRVLAAKAFMGLGFAGQQKGEHENALESYMKSLQLWESEIGSDHASLACLHYTIGTVLSQMRNDLEASVHFNNALNLLKATEQHDERVRASILSIEGMIFSVLGEVGLGIDCFRKALIMYQNFKGPLDLSYSTVMYEMGTLLAQQGDIEDAIICYKNALDIREITLGNSFVVMQTHYSLGVTLAQDDSPSSQDYALIHLEKALGLCGNENIQAPTIIHAIGVLKEKMGDFHAAANWFYKELDTMKFLFGEDDERVGMCSSDVGSCFFQIGKYDLATVLFEQALRILLQVTENEQSLEVADLLYKIASCHESLCEYDEALGIFEEVKQIRQTLTGIESSPVIKAMLRIGNVQLSRGESQLALDCFNEILGIGYASDSINGIEVANALYGRGCAQYCLFQLTDAMKSLNESLNWKLAALGEDDPGLACIFYQMAHVYLEQSEKEDAILCFEEYMRLLKIDKQRNLQDNAEICQTAGILCKLKEEYDKALAFYDQALAMFETLFGNKQVHEKLATIHFDIGCIHTMQGNNKEALRQLQLCLAMRKKLFGAHVEVANVLFEMAVVLQQEDMTKTAVMCLEESDSIWKTQLGCSEKLISVCHASGKLWKSLLRHEEAEGNFEKALELAITIHGRCHDTVASILLDLGELLHEIGQYEQALFCYDESLDVRTQLFGPDDLNVAAVLYCKGVALLFQEHFDAAYECLNRSLKIRHEKLGDVNNDVGDTLNTIGFLQLRKGIIADSSALAPLTKALDIRRALGNKNKVVSTLQNLASLYKKRKEFDMCMAMHSEILAVRQEVFGTNHEKVAEAWINLGNIQTTAGHMIEATLSYEEALRIRTLSSGYNRKSVAHVLFKLGLLNSRQDNYENAKQLFEEYIRLRAEEEDDPDQEMAQALTLIGDIQLDTGEKSKAQINWMSALEIYMNLGYPEDHPKVVKLKMRQKTVPTFGLFGHRRMSSIDVNRVAGDLSSVVDGPLSLFSRLTGVTPDISDSTENNVCVNH